MSDWTSFSELMPLDDGLWGLRTLQCKTVPVDDQAYAEQLVLDRQSIILVANGYMGVSDCLFPSAMGVAQDPWKPNQNMVCSWLDFLNRIGMVSFDHACLDGRLQVIPQAYALPQRILDQPISDDEAQDSDMLLWGIKSVEDLVECAPPTSIAGIARDVGVLDEFNKLVSMRPRRFWMDLLVPLYQQISLSADGGTDFSFATDFGDQKLDAGCVWSTWSVLARTVNVHISSHGELHVQAYPIDRFGFSHSVNHMKLQRDQLDEGCRTRQNFRVDQELDMLFEHVNLILFQLFFNEGGGCFDEGEGWSECASLRDQPFYSDLKRWQWLFMERIHTEIESMIDCLYERVYPFDGRARTPAHIDWLYAYGDTTIRARRNQAANIAPFIVTKLMRGECPRATAAIDAAKPLLVALEAEFADIKTWAWRRVAALPNLSTEWPYGLHLSEAAEMITALGPQCPVLDDDTLYRIVEFMRSFSSHRDGFSTSSLLLRRVLNSIGKSAGNKGWNSLGQTLSELMESRLELSLYDSVATATVSKELQLMPKDGNDKFPITVRQVVDEWLGGLCINQLLASSTRLADANWNICHIALPKFVFHRMGRVLLLFGSTSWVETKVQLKILNCRQLLEKEAIRMANCLRNLWPCVRNQERLLISMTKPGTQQRATLALKLDRNSDWVIAEISGVANTKVHRDSAFIPTAIQLCRWLSDRRNDLDPELLAGYINCRRDEDSIDLDCFAELAVQDLPESLQKEALACLPGAGTIKKRISHAVARLRVRRQQNPKVATVPAHG